MNWLYSNNLLGKTYVQHALCRFRPRCCVCCAGRNRSTPINGRTKSLKLSFVSLTTVERWTLKHWPNLFLPSFFFLHRPLQMPYLDNVSSELVPRNVFTPNKTQITTLIVASVYIFVIAILWCVFNFVQSWALTGYLRRHVPYLKYISEFIFIFSKKTLVLKNWIVYPFK